MTQSRAALWQQMIALSPLCSGSLHQQYLRCGKKGCRCRDPKSPQPHGPYYLWIPERVNDFETPATRN